MVTMPPDPELQEVIDDLRNGYGDRSVNDAPVKKNPRQIDWALRTGVSRRARRS